jgi:hypothetical protein
MRIFTVAFFLLFTCLVPHSLIAGVLKGKVTDKKGEPLPYATVFVEGSTMGVNANGNGDYELTLPEGLYKVVCQYIGYKQSTFNADIKGNETKEHLFVLEDQRLEMKEVTIHASTEDPAYGIIRNAIKRRKYHRDQVRTLQTGIYLKAVARSRELPDKVMGKKVDKTIFGTDSAGKGVVYLAEENADYYAAGEKEKTVIHSVHVSGQPGGLGFSQFPSIITFYDNDMNIIDGASRGFISPISDNALNYYKYKLQGQFTEHGHTIYKIQVIQKRDYEPCFNGTIYIVDSEWAIHSLNMLLTKKSNMDMFDTLQINQLFILVDNSWIIKSQVMYYTIKFFGIDGTANFVTVYNNQTINNPVPDSIFASKVTSVYDWNANKKDSAVFKDRPVPLEGDEKKSFVVKDSISRRIHSPEYRDSVRKKGNHFNLFGFLISGITYNGKDYNNTYTTNSLLLGITNANMINYNIVEGFNIDPKFYWRHKIDSQTDLHVDAAVRYGFSNTHLNAIARVYNIQRDKHWTGRQWIYGIEGGKYVYQYNPENPVLEWFNTYADLIYRENDLKIYERWDASVYLGRNYGNGLSWFVKPSYQQCLPLQNTTDFSILGGNTEAGYTNNLPPHLAAVAQPWVKNDAAIINATISYQPGYHYTQFPDYKISNGDSKWPIFTLHYEKGIPGIINSVSDFDKWRFNIRQDISLKLLGTLKYNLVAGGFLNSRYVAVPDLMHLYGDRGIGYAAPYLNSFQFAQYYEFSNKEPIYGEAHLEYHLDGLLSNKIPLLRQARYFLLFGGNAFYAGSDDYYTEAFVGVDNIGWKFIRVLRVDFVQSWDSHMGHNSGIRFGLTLPGLSAGSNPTHSEW